MSLKGRKNAYWCESCHGYVVTIDLDAGVTPMFLACRVKGEPSDPANDCDGRMTSQMYPEEPWPATDGYETPIPTEPTWEWYRPDMAEMKRLRRKDRQGLDQTFDHVRRGGLLLRRIDGWS